MNAHVLKVLLLGDGSVGKSSLMKRFIANEFEEKRNHTIGVEFLNKDIIRNNQTYTLQIWDTAGQERFRTLRTPFYRGTEICFLVFSLNDIETFENLSMWRDEFCKYTDLNQPDLFPFVVLGNKCDLPSSERAISSETAAAWCSNNGGIPYFETSAKTAENVEDAFISGIDRWIQLETAPGQGDIWSRLPSSSSNPNIQLHRNSQKQRGINSKSNCAC